jgi:hypothetical protein
MTAKDVYAIALGLLGYTDNPEFQRRAVPIFNKVYFDLYRICNGTKDFAAIRSLNEKLSLPDNVLLTVMPSGIAEMIALGEGDGELQQYFAADYDRLRARLSKTDKIENVLF